MEIIATTAIAAIIGIVVLCLIARDISREIRSNEELRVKNEE